VYAQKPIAFPTRRVVTPEFSRPSQEEEMATVNLDVQVRRLNDQVGILDIKGEVTGFAENVLMDAYTQASNGQTRSIVLNFSQLDYMNSSGIGLLVTLLIRTQRQKQNMYAYGLSDHYRQIFKLTRLNEAIKVFDSESEALTSVQ
jgi:anti-sigma B factor antagonist